jgi:two-component system, cell cycle sensor histidine kinase and response regulator CckA
MTRSLRIVVVDDPLATAHALVGALSRHDFAPTVREVESFAPLVDVLGREDWDLLVLSALHPDGLADHALDWVHQHVPGLPVLVVVPGEVAANDEAVLKAVRGGARDYIGSDDEARFVAAVLRETARRAAASEAGRPAPEAAGQLLRDQARLQGMQKMEAVGRLAGGIAHDFNNLVQAITGHTEVLLKALPEGDGRRRSAEGIKRAGERAATLTRQLLAFSRQQVMQAHVLDVNEVVGNVELLLRRRLGEQAELRLNLAPDLDSVRADRTQLEQVLMNLVANARDASPHGGTVTIETGNAVLSSAASGAPFAVAPGRYVLLSVRDTGEGMTPDVKARAFEPFFTTRPLGQGTGLGLSTVYGIIKQSGGYIWVDSEAGAGTRVRIYLPRAEAPAEVREPRASTPRVRRGEETLLIVEDEVGVRELIQEWLQAHGYRVLSAGNGLDALDVCAAHTDAIDLVVADVVMPSMGGPALVQHLTPTRPDLKVIYMSGYTDDALGDRRMLDGGTPFLQKPFTLDTLVQKVREVLDGA